MSNTPLTSRRKLGPAPAQEAKVKELAKLEYSELNESSIEKRILDRIKKCLTKANHPNTGEREAQAAWRLSTRLMQQYNVTQADLLERATNEDNYAAMGGQSTVAISRAKDDGLRVTHQTWVDDVGAAMDIFFDCSHYTTARLTSVDWTYYGPAANTVPAAMAFEMAHNLALEWARTKGGDKNSYCFGIGAGLVRQAREEKTLEKKRAEEREREQREQREEIERNKTYGKEPAECSNGVGIAEQPRTSPASNIAPVSPGSTGGRMHDVTMEDDEEDVKKQPSIKSEDDIGKFAIQSEFSGEGHEDGALFKRDDSDDDNNSRMLDPGYVSDEDEAEIETTFKEEDEKPIDFEADFDEQLREAMPIPNLQTQKMPQTTSLMTMMATTMTKKISWQRTLGTQAKLLCNSASLQRRWPPST